MTEKREGKGGGRVYKDSCDPFKKKEGVKEWVACSWVTMPE